jgi:hypothetical protein
MKKPLRERWLLGVVPAAAAAPGVAAVGVERKGSEGR